MHDYLDWLQEYQPPRDSDTRRLLPEAPKNRSDESTRLDEPQTADTEMHELELPDGGVAKLVVPVSLTQEQIDAIWDQLDPLKKLLETKAKIRNPGLEPRGG